MFMTHSGLYIIWRKKEEENNCTGWAMPFSKLNQDEMHTSKLFLCKLCSVRNTKEKKKTHTIMFLYCILTYTNLLFWPCQLWCRIPDKILINRLFKNIFCTSEMSSKSFWTSDKTSKIYVLTSILIFFSSEAQSRRDPATPPFHSV